MSKVAVRPLDRSCSADGPDLGAIGPRLLSLSVDAVTDLLQGVAGLLGAALASRPPSALRCPPRSDCCAIPEVDCPPRCVCEIDWEAALGEKLHCTVRVENSSATTRTFHVQATPFSGPGGAGPAVAVAPASFELAGGASRAVEATFAVPEEMAVGAHEAEIVVRGAYEQCVRVVLRVTGKPRCGPESPPCRCTVTQGDPPVRIRAHHWYDHFQCAEPCVRRHTRDGR